MQGIQFREKMGSTSGKCLGGQAFQMLPTMRLREQVSHSGGNMFRVAEQAFALGNADAAKATSPRVDVLKEVAMDRPIMRDAQTTGGKRFTRALFDDLLLESLQPAGIPDAEAVS